MIDWKNKKVLVTGANGFIGSWLTEKLLNEGADVSVLIKKDDPIGLDSLKHLKNIKISYGDIRDSKSIEKAVSQKEIIFHLAAITQVLYSIKNPAETVEVDVNGTLNILEALRKSAEENTFLVFSSTDKVYGEPSYMPIDEKHSLSSKSPYDAAKLAADRLVYSYHKSYGLKTTISRWSNTIGGRDSNILRAVPDFVRSLLTGKSPVIRGNGKHIRDYMYVEDSVRGILLLAEKQKLSNGEVFNFGTERPTTVLELCNKIINIIGLEIKPVLLNNDTKGEIDKQYLSAQKAKEVLGWKPLISLEDGLKRTIEWYKSNQWWFDVMDRASKYYKIS